MNTRLLSWLGMPLFLILSGCPTGGGGAGGGFEASPFSLDAYIKASNTEAQDGFGRMVAMDGDTLVVGVPDEDSTLLGVTAGSPSEAATPNGATASGAVYVFTRSPLGVWTQQAYIKASNTGAGDAFGTVVLISGDTLVVGAPGEDSALTGVVSTTPPPNEADTLNNATDSGAVYVFTRTAGVWTQRAYIKASNTGAGDAFGAAVALSGTTLVVGAPEEASNAIGINGSQSDNSTAGAGAVYVFTGSGATWTQQAYVKASNTGAQDNFGTTVAISGTTFIVGAPGEDGNGIGANPGAAAEADNTELDSGAVYVFIPSVSPPWTQQAYVKASNTEAGDAFGTALTFSGDTFVAGAPGENSNATGINGNQNGVATAGAGAAYVFTWSAGVWSQQAYVKASNTGAGDAFGTALVLDGDTLVVAATLEDSNATGTIGDQANNDASNSGAIYVFSRLGTTWSQQTYVKASNTGADDNFGTSVGLSGGILVVGATGEDSNANGIGGTQIDNSFSASGAVYAFQ